MTNPATSKVADETFSDVSAYGSRLWCATRLGKPKEWLARNRAALQSLGFPAPDPLIGHFLKADVDKWIAKQSKMSMNELRVESSPPIIQQERLHAF